MARVAHHAVSVLVASGYRAAVADCLVTGRGVRDSAELDPAERARNLSGRILLRTGRLPPPGAAVVLIDDVITTGATVAGCLRVLDSASIRPMAVVGLTATSG